MFGDYVDNKFSAELEIKDSTHVDRFASFLDIDNEGT